MGDNAKASWEWHNHEVGKGYQARGVIRQPGSSNSVNVVDLSKPIAPTTKDSVPKQALDGKAKKEGKERKEKEVKKSERSGKHSRMSAKARFNPLLQLLATRLSDKTMSFT